MSTTRNPVTRLAILIGGQPWLPRYAKVIVGLDRLLQRLSRGRVDLLTFAGLPEILLQVPGRRTGLLRSTPLLCVPHTIDGCEGWLVVGSNWGAPEPPAWVANLSAAREPLVTYRGRTVVAAARLVTGAEREEIWSHLIEVWPNYAKYAARTGRELPVFWLTPR